MKIVTFLICSSLAPTALANDSVSRIGAGGLELVATDAIQMQKEVLQISTKKITVDYDFYNKTSADISTLVAFPMPVYGWNAQQSAGDLHMGPIADFQVWSQGRSVKTEAHYKALLDKREISKELEAIGLSREQIYTTFAGCTLETEFTCSVSAQQIEKLKKIGAYSEEGYATKMSYTLGPTWNVWKLGALWDVEQTLVWPQVFSAGKLTHITHAYTPLVGGRYNLPLNQSQREKKIEIQSASGLSVDDNGEACVDESFKRAYFKRIDDLQKAGAKTIVVTLDDVEYVLGTGRNWSGPIQDFTLRIKKESKEQLISLCFPGKPTRIDPLTIEFKHKDFVPQDRLVVYFYSFRVE